MKPRILSEIPIFADQGWAAFEGTGSSLAPPAPHSNSLPWIGLCLMSLAIVGLVVVLLILYKRSRGETKVRFVVVFFRRIGTSFLGFFFLCRC